MKFDDFTVALLIARPDAPKLDEKAEDELQDRHMAHLSDLHDQGVLLAAGPVFDEKVRGISLLNLPPDEARKLAEEDPSVLAGVYSIEILPWKVPAGAMHFSKIHLPRSLAEVSS